MVDLLQMRGISKHFRGTQALRSVDFSAQAGEVHAVVGENGAGKSTLMKILAGVLKRDSGRILLDDQPIEPDTPARARALGIQPTHLDSHMGTLYQSKALFEVFLRVARREKLPVRVAKTWFARADFLPSVLSPDDVYIDRVLDINASVPAKDWAKFYSDAIKKLEPGVTEIVIHLAYDDAEMQGATINHPDWGAAWRQRPTPRSPKR